MSVSYTHLDVYKRQGQKMFTKQTLPEVKILFLQKGMYPRDVVAVSYTHLPHDQIPLNPSIRTLTPQERSWIQTFPKDVNWGEASKTNVNLAIGNAVPVKLAEYIANCIKEYIYGKKNN